EVAPQEGPRALRPLVLLVSADVTAPHRACARPDQDRHEAGGLGIVDDNDVPLTNERQHLLCVSAQNLLVVGPLLVAQVATIPGRAVEAVVDPLRDVEERRIALDDEPPDV